MPINCGYHIVYFCRPLPVPAVTQPDCIIQDVKVDDHELQDSKQAPTFSKDTDNHLPTEENSDCVVATGHPTAYTLSPDVWAKAAEFVPGQLWQGLGRIDVWCSCYKCLELNQNRVQTMKQDLHWRLSLNNCHELQLRLLTQSY
jgi:hypothetical protein